MKLSVIIPVYNAEKYLKRCLDSILKLELIDWECILVNDGSKDRSLQILKEYQSINNRFKVKDITNAGVSNARNVGIENASGDVCFFLDADDELEANADRILQKELINFKINSLVVFSYYREQADGRKDLYTNIDIETKNYSECVKELAVVSHRLNSCWGKFFDLQILRDKSIRFDTSMKIGEDTKFVMDYLRYASSIVLCNNPILMYYYNASGAMSNAEMCAFYDEEKTFQKRQQLIKEFNIQMTKEDYSKMCKIYCNMLIYYTILECRKRTFLEMTSLIKKYFSLQYVKFIIEKVELKDFKKSKALMIFFLKKGKYSLFILSVVLTAKFRRKYRRTT